MVLGFSKGFNGLGLLKCMNFNNFQCLALHVFNTIQDGGPKRPPPLSVFPLQLLQMLELAPKFF